MKTPSNFRFGYTLIELLISVTLSLLLLLGVTEMFRHVGSTMSDTQKSLNMSSNLNAVAMTLRSDLTKSELQLAHQPAHISGGGNDLAAGYLEITEGMNAPVSDINNVVTSGDLPSPLNNEIHQAGTHFPISFVALDSNDQFNPKVDQTVGDVDDILAFTAKADSAYPFRGLINNVMGESLYAEIIWFLRGTNLYRRVLLLDDHNQANLTASPFYENNDVSVYWDSSSSSLKRNTLPTLTRRENRFAHSGTSAFPYPLYTSNKEWYSLRIPTLEETVASTSLGSLNDWTLGQLPGITSPDYTLHPASHSPIFPYWDFWQAPNGPVDTPTGILRLDEKTGSISSYVNNPRHLRAGEDIILRNVISFDIKVWNPYWVPCYEASNLPGTTASSADFWLWAPPQYVDLGQDRFILKDTSGIDQECFVNYQQDLNSANIPSGLPSSDVGYGFTLKGRYNTSVNSRRTITDTTEEWYRKERLHNGTTVNQLLPPTFTAPMPCVFDSWTNNYQLPYTSDLGYLNNDASTWRCPPPYDEKLESIQITIRCFEPQSGNIKQVRVVHRFDNSP